MVDFAMPVVFNFTVEVAGFSSPEDLAFQEVSGLDLEFETEDIHEGGENTFVHRLPKKPKRTNLVLKRGVAAPASDLLAWCVVTLESGLAVNIEPKDVVVSLRDGKQKPISVWNLSRAWPVKVQIAPFNAMKSEIAIETLELAYGRIERVE